MEIELREVDRSNWHACCAMKVAPEQQHFVAPNAFSLAQAAYEPDMHPMVILKDGEMVGFVMWGFNSELCGWEMYRLMIDPKYQAQGIGTTALRALFRLLTAKLGHILFYTSAVQDNAIAIALYERMGFRKTGQILGGEVILEIQL